MKEYQFKEMSIDDARVIDTWRYDGYVKSIYTKPYFDSYESKGIVRGPNDSYAFSVYDNEEVVGLFEYYNVNDIMEIGLALNPLLVGKHLGTDFVINGVNFGVKHFKYHRDYLELTVNEQNRPAVVVYLKAGFIKFEEKNGDIRMRKYLK